MYRYFLGNHCNSMTKKKNDPFVIKATNTASHAVEEWLMKYHIELELLIDNLVALLKNEICEMIFEDTYHFVLMLENNEYAFLELLEESQPMCKVQVDDLIVALWIQKDFHIENFSYVQDDRIITFTHQMDAIQLEDATNITIIHFPFMHFETYLKLKSTLKEVDTLDNIPKLLFWLSVGVPLLKDYEIRVTSKEPNEVDVTQVQVENHRLKSYTIVNKVGTFETCDNRSWKAALKGLYQEYNSETQEYMTRIAQGIVEDKERYAQLRAQMNQIINAMMKTHQLLNNTIRIFLSIRGKKVL